MKYNPMHYYIGIFFTDEPRVKKYQVHCDISEGFWRYYLTNGVTRLNSRLVLMSELYSKENYEKCVKMYYSAVDSLKEDSTNEKEIIATLLKDINKAIKSHETIQ